MYKRYNKMYRNIISISRASDKGSYGFGIRFQLKNLAPVHTNTVVLVDSPS